MLIHFWFLFNEKPKGNNFLFLFFVRAERGVVDTTLCRKRREKAKHKYKIFRMSTKSWCTYGKTAAKEDSSFIVFLRHSSPSTYFISCLFSVFSCLQRRGVSPRMKSYTHSRQSLLHKCMHNSPFYLAPLPRQPTLKFMLVSFSLSLLFWRIFSLLRIGCGEWSQYIFPHA